MAEFNNQSLLTQAPVEPDQMLWSNLKYSFAESKKRRLLVFLVALLMSQVSLFSNILINKLTESIPDVPECDQFEEGILPEEAMND